MSQQQAALAKMRVAHRIQGVIIACQLKTGLQQARELSLPSSQGLELSMFAM
jgi:hypothetical protein